MSAGRGETGLSTSRQVLAALCDGEEFSTPLCPHFGRCGGCTMQDIPYQEQLRIKEEQLRNLPGVEHFEGILVSPRPTEYRNKMEFSFGDEQKGGPLTLGMHRRGSFHDVVTVDHCRIVDEDFRRILAYSHGYFARRYQTQMPTDPAPLTSQTWPGPPDESPYTYYHRRRHKGYLRHLLVRKAAASGEILVALVTTSQEEHDLGEWRDGLMGLSLTGSVNGILHIINDSVADVVRADELRVLSGRDHIHEELLGLRFKISTFSFFQTNTAGAELLYTKVREYVMAAVEDGPNRPTVFDLYCGTGTIAAVVAPLAGKVIGVDISAEAIEAARDNAKSNSLQSCEFITGDVLRVLDEIEERPDLIILDPPRDGLHPKTLPKVLAHGVRHIIYISCKPASFVRDLPAFTTAGYAVTRSAAIDLFPATANVELVCLLERQDLQ